jgi:hypothetical protein
MPQPTTLPRGVEEKGKQETSTKEAGPSNPALNIIFKLAPFQNVTRGTLT